MNIVPQSSTHFCAFNFYGNLAVPFFRTERYKEINKYYWIVYRENTWKEEAILGNVTLSCSPIRGAHPFYILKKNDLFIVYSKRAFYGIWMHITKSYFSYFIAPKVSHFLHLRSTSINNKSFTINFPRKKEKTTIILIKNSQPLALMVLQFLPCDSSSLLN